MARRYRRFKLRAHDLGINRHNKGVAHESKAARLQADHVRHVEQGHARRAARRKAQE